MSFLSSFSNFFDPGACSCLRHEMILLEISAPPLSRVAVVSDVRNIFAEACFQPGGWRSASVSAFFGESFLLGFTVERWCDFWSDRDLESSGGDVWFSRDNSRF